MSNAVELTEKVNGNGIPKKVIDNIFQPFFTTRPTGEGTGLGLSLSYDIIKAHGGTVKAESKEGKGAEFIIELPLSDITNMLNPINPENPINHFSNNSYDIIKRHESEIKIETKEVELRIL